MKKLIFLIRKYPFIFIAIFLLIIIMIIIIITILNMRATEDVELLVAPSSATTTIDGRIYKNGTIKIEPGEHAVHIEKEGFVSQDFTFNTASSKKIYTYLRQVDGSVSWYLSHPEDSQILTQIGDFIADQEEKSYAEKYPIVQDLPIIYANYDSNYNYIEFRIDGGSFDGCNTDFCLKVTDTTGGNMELAKNKIKIAGYNPGDYQILYEYKPIQPLD